MSQTLTIAYHKPLEPLFKSPAILKKSGKAEWRPVLYLKKAKNISQKDYERVCSILENYLSDYEPKEAL